jgi:Sec-independent protein translocase protein TatA
MPRPKPNKLHDELDALLDGRPVELTDELAPLAEAADALRAELAAFELDPRVADRHLERVLDGSAPVVRLPVRPQLHGWDLRRRVAAVALAAALVLAPATMASAAALPGQAMYPFKRAIEELRIASVQWSPGREAGERTRVADERREEVVQLTNLKMFTQLPTAITSLLKAVKEAQAAANDAREDGKLPLAVEQQLNGVAAASSQALRHVSAVAANASVFIPKDTLDAIKAAVDQSQGVLPPDDPPAGGTATPTTAATQPTNSPGSTTDTTQTSTTVGQSSTTGATSTTEAATTTTQASTTTTAPPTESSVTPESAGGTGGDDDQTGADGSADEGVPTTTVPGP